MARESASGHSRRFDRAPATSALAPKPDILLRRDALTNFDNTSDEELRAYFIENGLSETEADEWLAKRSLYNLNIVMQDDRGNDVGIFDPHTQTIKPLI
jgi:hypothetical protein